MGISVLFAVGGASFLCGVALMYLVMMRTHKKLQADSAAAA